ncbi:geranyltranstransferase [Desulfamplus magnetovallimortis]|uniref:Geranyltranstransferase n=1 Tax=Desulfamplus magnetovallimortis TaxID=1246637 RepID=L0R3R6_9BACT|nr:farnesyl diphosphate synthase [Desulfamplus magnetovallimortis]CCO06628.1 geranyltranstransferase [Desulfamplus magnetovallimortis BW-1]SLM32679.1 geranyltranstransferase [Desulfamplus magnetovallimortis]
MNKSINITTDTLFDLSAYLKEKRAILDDYLKKVIQELNPENELAKAIEHSLMAGGKRLRPILAMAAAQATGKDFRLALPAACSIEMIHTYSLIHDDLPAMDNDDLRRGIPTCHKAFSEATAILAGDALLTHAFTILTHNPRAMFDPCPNDEILFKLVAMISRAAGAHGMVEGQMMDMQATGFLDQHNQSKVNIDNCLAHLKKLHELKTGKMIVVSVESGALSAGADPDQIERLAKYAGKVGLAFQVADDILNVEGDPYVMGKAAGSDAMNNKMTFPALLGLEPSRTFARNLIQEALEPLNTFNEKDILPLKAIAGYIVDRKR